MLSLRETVVELPFAAGCCPCVEKLRTVLPVTVWYQRRCGAFGEGEGEGLTSATAYGEGRAPAAGLADDGRWKPDCAACVWRDV
jgi:hypothetical protein